MRLRSLSAGCLVAVVLTTALPRGARAQDHTLQPGDTVRVLAAEHAGVIQGELLLYQGDSLGVRDASTGTAYRFPLSAIRRLEKNEGLDRRRSVRRWATAGLFLGSALGLVTGPLIATADPRGGMLGPTALSGLGGAALGLGLGAAGGSLFAGDHWQRFRTPIQPPRAEVGVRVPVP